MKLITSKPSNFLSVSSLPLFSFTRCFLLKLLLLLFFYYYCYHCHHCCYYYYNYYYRCYHYYSFYSYHESGFLSHIKIEVNRLFTPVKKFKSKLCMSKQSAITHSKLTKEIQEKAVKQAQSQQHRHHSDIIDITLLPPSLILYLIHTRLHSQHFHFKHTNADIVHIS